MSQLKDLQKKLLSELLTAKMMEYMMGLNKKQKHSLERKAGGYSEKLVREYFNARKHRHKKAVKATAVKKAKREANAPVTGMHAEQTNLLAS